MANSTNGREDSMPDQIDQQSVQRATCRRRSVLRAGAALPATAVAASLAGCLGVLGRPDQVAYPLDRADPRVRAARRAEGRAYEHYGLEFDEHFVDVDPLGVRVRVYTVGSAEPVVALAGGIGEGLKWLPLLPELADFTVYVIDRPGAGLSDGIDHRALPLDRTAASVTEAVFDNFDLDTASVMGSSMGGLWSLRFALAHPERVERIALLGTPALYPGTSSPVMTRLSSIPGLGGFLMENVVQPESPNDTRKGWGFLGHPDETVQSLPEEYAEATYRMDNLPYYRLSWESLAQTSVNLWGAVPKAALTPADLEGIRSPVTLLWGSDDPFGSVTRGRGGAEHFADASFHVVGIGHLPWLDEPERCGALVSRFVNESG